MTMRATRPTLPKSNAIRYALGMSEGIVRKVTLEESAAVAVADLIDRSEAVEAVVEAARAYRKHRARSTGLVLDAALARLDALTDKEKEHG